LASRYASIASTIFARLSSLVSPCYREFNALGYVAFLCMNKLYGISPADHDVFNLLLFIIFSCF
jgi:hypothetical protein